MKKYYYPKSDDAIQYLEWLHNCPQSIKRDGHNLNKTKDNIHISKLSSSKIEPSLYRFTNFELYHSVVMLSVCQSCGYFKPLQRRRVPSYDEDFQKFQSSTYADIATNISRVFSDCQLHSDHSTAPVELIYPLTLLSKCVCVPVNGLI